MLSLKTESLSEIVLNEKMLRLTATKIRDGEMELAKRLLNDAIQAELMTVSHGDQKTIQRLIFARALLRYLAETPSSNCNLYLKKFQNSQIDLFNLVASRLPLVSVAAQIANDTLCAFLCELDQAVLIDVGIGTGRQITDLILRLKGKERRLSTLTVVGIEPSVENLILAEKEIQKAAKQADLSVRFIQVAKCAEEMEDKEWRVLESLEGSVLINEAFAIHHVSGRSPGGEAGDSHGDAKDRLLRRLKALNPVAFVLTEPDSNHQSEDLVERFENSWKHFSAVFRLVDCLNISDAEKGGIKLEFFSREIDDIIGNPDEATRAERHESAQMWVARLKRAGFTLVDSESAVWKIPAQVPLVQVSKLGDHLGIRFEDESILSLICAV